MSKFEWSMFYGDNEYFAVSKERFSEAEAIKIMETQTEWDGNIAISDGYVRYKRALTDDEELYAGWWLENEYQKRSCSCWVFEPFNEKAPENSYKVLKR